MSFMERIKKLDEITPDRENTSFGNEMELCLELIKKIEKLEQRIQLLEQLN